MIWSAINVFVSVYIRRDCKKMISWVGVNFSSHQEGHRSWRCWPRPLTRLLCGIALCWWRPLQMEPVNLAASLDCAWKLQQLPLTYAYMVSLSNLDTMFQNNQFLLIYYFIIWYERINLRWNLQLGAPNSNNC